MARKPIKIEDILKSAAGHLNQHLLQETKEPEKKPLKHSNIRTVVDDIKFDSIKEAKRYRVLKWRLKRGLIGNLELQQEYELNPGGTFSYKYRCDFRYLDAETGDQIVEDCKGMRTKEYKKKKKLMLKIHKIKIFET